MRRFLSRAGGRPASLAGAVLALGVLSLALGCESEGADNGTPDPGGSDPGTVADAGGGVDAGDPNATGPACGFDPAKAGMKIGDHIENFPLMSLEGGEFVRYDLHRNCGKDKKVVWMILATGW